MILTKYSILVMRRNDGRRARVYVAMHEQVNIRREKRNNAHLLKSCRMEAVAPTQEGYKRTAGTCADNAAMVTAPILLFENLFLWEIRTSGSFFPGIKILF